MKKQLIELLRWLLLKLEGPNAHPLFETVRQLESRVQGLTAQIAVQVLEFQRWEKRFEAQSAEYHRLEAEFAQERSEYKAKIAELEAERIMPTVSPEAFWHKWQRTFIEPPIGASPEAALKARAARLSSMTTNGRRF